MHTLCSGKWVHRAEPVFAFKKKREMSPKINVSPRYVTEDFILVYCFFTPRIELLKALVEERSAVSSACETSLLFTATGIPC